MENINIWEEIHGCQTTVSLARLLSSDCFDEASAKIAKKVINYIKKHLSADINELFYYSSTLGGIYTRSEFVHRVLSVPGLIADEFGDNIISTKAVDTNVRRAILINIFSSVKIYENFNIYEGVYVNNLINKIIKIAREIHATKSLLYYLIPFFKNDFLEYHHLGSYLAIMFRQGKFKWFALDNCSIFINIITKKDMNLSLFYPERKKYILNKLEKILSIL